MIDPLEINGTQPAVEGHVCEEMLAEVHWHAGKATAPANVVHLQFSGSWLAAGEFIFEMFSTSQATETTGQNLPALG